MIVITTVIIMMSITITITIITIVIVIVIIYNEAARAELHCVTSCWSMLCCQSHMPYRQLEVLQDLGYYMKGMQTAVCLLSKVEVHMPTVCSTTANCKTLTSAVKQHAAAELMQKHQR